MGQRPAGGPGTADARARAVRDFAAGAFRLPPEADQAEEALAAGEQAGTSSAEGGATAPQASSTNSTVGASLMPFPTRPGS